MYRPSQTPHPTLSSARIASQNKFPTERKKLKAAERTKPRPRPKTPHTRQLRLKPRRGLHKLQHKNQARRGSRLHEGGRQLAAHSASPTSPHFTSPFTPLIFTDLNENLIFAYTTKADVTKI